MIPYGRQSISQVDIDAVIEVLHSDWLTQGPLLPRFEQAVADYGGAANAVAVNSATSALHIACLALDVGPGDWVWTSPITFVASSNSALYCGAQVDFVDIDSRTYNLSVERLSEKLSKAKAANKLPKVLIPVHFAGQPCDMPAIHELSREYGFKIIEDASHAIGASYSESPNLNSGVASDASETDIARTKGPWQSRKPIKVGSCAHSDITVFSFHPVKIITTGEGGMALTNDANLAERMACFRSHGMISKRELMQPRPVDEIWNYQQIELGFNYRMTDIQAALGLSQLQRLDAFVQRRHEIACRYDEAFAALPIVMPWQHPATYSSYHLYPIRLNPCETRQTQREIYGKLHAAGIGVNLHYIPVYRQPYYEALGFKRGYCAEAERYYREALTIPLYPTLSDADQEKVIRVLQEILA